MLLMDFHSSFQTRITIFQSNHIVTDDHLEFFHQLDDVASSGLLQWYIYFELVGQKNLETYLQNNYFFLKFYIQKTHVFIKNSFHLPSSTIESASSKMTFKSGSFPHGCCLRNFHGPVSEAQLPQKISPEISRLPSRP